MFYCVYKKIMTALVLSAGLLFLHISYAGPYGHDNGNWHGHHGGGYNNGRYHNRDYYNPGFAWGVPNIIINVPTRRYYAPVCETVEECNSYGECWLQRYCD